MLDPQKKFFHYGVGIKLLTEIQINRNLVVYSTINQPIDGNFDRKVSRPTSALEHVRTEVVDYLQKVPIKKPYITNLNVENIWSPFNDFYAKINFEF